MSGARFDYVAGVGGIGSGVLFLLEGEHDLGRNESRLGELTDYQDYCKLHIILHYTAVLLEGALPVFPIGRVGRDENGARLISLMQKAGMDTAFVTTDPEKPTMYAVCFQYPNGEGGNLTASNSASAEVCEEDVDRFFASRQPGERGLLLAAPEAPLAARIHLLKRGRALGCYNAASLLSGEAARFVEDNLFECVDLLSVNEDEAAAILRAAGVPAAGESPAEACGAYLQRHYPGLSVFITLGKRGVRSFAGGRTESIPAIAGKPVSTAGAGDCFLGAVLACIAHCIPLQEIGEKGVLRCAAELGSLAAGFKVQSRDSIHFGLTKDALAAFAAENGLRIAPNGIWNVQQAT